MIMKNKTILTLATAFLLMQVTAVQAQDKGLTAEQAKRMHQEKLDDPYLPNAYNNQRTSPAYRYGNRVKSNATRTSITTVQVNVDASGRNIMGDAANEPSIAVNPADRNKMVIGWRQFDNVGSNFRQAGWAYTTDGGEKWTFPGVIEPGIFRSDPVLGIDSEGNFFYNSLTNDPDYFCKVFESNNGGAAWDNGTDARGGDKQWMAIDRTGGAGNGNIYSFWSYYLSTCQPGFFTRSVSGSSSYEDCTTVDGNPYWGTMAIGLAGELYIAGTNGNPDSLVVVRSDNARDGNSPVSWNRPVSVYVDGRPNGWGGVNPGGLLGQVSVDVDRSEGDGRGNVYVLSSVMRSSNGDPCDVMFSRSRDGGLTWSPPIRINDDLSSKNYQWFGTMSVAPDGRIDAIWLDTRDAPPGSDSSALYYSHSRDQGVTWSENERLSGSFDSHTGYPNQEKLGDYFDMKSDSTGAHLAWAGTFNGEQDVYYSHIVPYSSTGIGDLSGMNEISLYPNPVRGTLIITGLTPGSRVEIYSLPGKRVHSEINGNSSCEIDLSDRPAGIYFLKIIERNGSTRVQKIIRE
jgi:hypothetical protein